MPDMPTRIKLGALTYTLEHSHQATVEYQKTAGEDVFGVCQHRPSRIIIDEGYPLCSMQKTLMHEALHALSYVYDLDQQKLGEEHTVRLLAMGLLGLLQDNPEIVAYLTNKEGDS